MIKFEMTNTYGWEAAIRGMRNPFNSWDKSDSKFEYAYGAMHTFTIGEKDLELMLKLRKGGSDDRKYARQIFVSVDITAPLYWWKEYDTYKVGTVANSTSTMHTLHKRDLTLADFSTDHMSPYALSVLEEYIHDINVFRRQYVETGDKQHWYDIIQLLPSSFNQKRTCTLNYENLINMYHARKFHKLDEWHILCDWVEQLPYSVIITG